MDKNKERMICECTNHVSGKQCGPPGLIAQEECNQELKPNEKEDENRGKRVPAD